MSAINLVVRDKDGKIKSGEIHGSYAVEIFQNIGIANGKANKRINGRMYGSSVAPVDSGIIVVDFKTKHILSLQGYFDLFEEVHPEGDEIDKRDKIVLRGSEKKGVFITNAPLVQELTDRYGWTIIQYNFQGYGFGLELAWIQNDLNELGIEPTDGDMWWVYFNHHYAWANIPNKKMYVGKENRLKPFVTGLTKKQAEMLRVLSERAFFEVKMKDHDKYYKVIEVLASKYCIKITGGGGGTMEGKMTWKYEVTT